MPHDSYLYLLTTLATVFTCATINSKQRDSTVPPTASFIAESAPAPSSNTPVREGEPPRRVPPPQVLRPPLAIGGIRINRLSWDESFEQVLAAAAEAAVSVSWVYANCVNIARRDHEYRAALQQSQFVLNDGAGIELAGRLCGKPMLNNLCGTDWIPQLLDLLEAQGPWTQVYLLGGSAEASQRAAERARCRWPSLSIVGARHGYDDEDRVALEEVKRARPEILVVGMGVPRQEAFIARNWTELEKAGVRISLAGGAIIDHLG